jgi:hypothetical protein
MIEAGIIDPDCLPPEYWTRYADKRAALKAQARAVAVTPAADCPACRLVTDPISPTTAQEPTNGRTADPAPAADPDAPAAAPAPEQPAE